MIKVRSTLHNHTVLCDGKATLDEFASSAIAEGIRDLGISKHTDYGVLPNGENGFDPDNAVWDEKKYIATVRACADKYASDLRIWCGVEQDFYAPVRDRSAYDYIIGSVHYIRGEADGQCHAIDSSPEDFELCLSELFGGDSDLLIRRYYELVTDNVLTYCPDIIGHFDLLTKYNSGNRYFNSQSESYRKTALRALDICAASGCVFELNMARQHYPEPFLLRELAKRGAPVTVSTDCHAKSNLSDGLDDGVLILRDCGFAHVHVWENGGFVKKAI